AVRRRPLLALAACRSVLYEDDERLAVLDDVCRELDARSVANIPDGMRGIRRNHQRLAGPVRVCADPVDGVLELALEAVDDLLARMLVPHRRRLRCQLDAVLDDHAPRNAEIVLLEIRPSDSRRLSDACHVDLLVV